MWYPFTDTNLKIMNRKIITLALILITGWQARAQLYISPEAELSVDGSDVTVIALENLDFVNNGAFELGSSDVYFISTDGTDRSISGSSNTAFDYLYVDMGSQDLILEQDIEAALVLFNSGRFDLNSNDVAVSGNIIDENDSHHFIGPNGGAIIYQTSLNAPVNQNPGRLGAIISSTANLGEVTIRRTHVPSVNDGGESIARRYTITSANNSDLDATLRFTYLSHELNGLPENELVLWQNSGSGWNLEGATDRDPSANWVELSGIDSFAEWTAATPGFTPVVELDGKGVMTISSPFPNPVEQGARMAITINSPQVINAHLRLTDQLGQALRQQVVELHPGEQQLSIDNHGLPAGLYYLNVSVADQQQTLKVTIQ
jgi:hypothetical protein